MAKVSFGLMSAVLFGAICANAADSWTVGQTNPQTGSVDKNGALVYACCSSAGTVDGVMFRAFSEMEGTGDVALYPSEDWNHLTGATYVSSSDETFSDEARRLLGGGVYNVKLSTHGLSSYSITLNNLVAGRRYMAQFWVCDARDGKSSYRLTFDGAATAYYQGNDARSGQWAKCLFTADATSKTITVVPNALGAAQLNALQLRDISGATVTWTTAATSGENDVSNDGTLLYAYHGLKPAQGDIMVNGVRFAAGTGGAAAWDENVSFSPAVGTEYDVFFDDSGNLGYSASYRDLVRGGFWVDTSSLYRASATLKGLTSGRNYLVQTWVLDNRSGNYYHRRVTLDGAATMRHNQGTQGGAGSFAVGRFTAASTEQTVYFLYDKTGSFIQPLFGPIQVRELDGTYPEHPAWTSGTTAADTGSVDSRGTLLYAYGGKSGTYCGLPMTAFVRDTSPRQGENLSYACGDATIDSGYYTTGSAYMPASATTDGNGNTISSEVRNLIGGGIYNDKITSEGGVELTLKNLKPGRRHLVQFWVCDARRTNTSWSMKFDGTSVSYGDSSLVGGWATRVFTATGETTVVRVVRIGPWQINALQVRVLDDVDEEVAWNGGDTVSGTWEKSYFLKATEGRTTLAGSFPYLCHIVASKGTAAIDADLANVQRLESYEPGTLEICSGRTVVSSSLAGDGTLTGAGRISPVEGATLPVTGSLTLDGATFDLGRTSKMSVYANATLTGTRIAIDNPAARLASGNDLLVIAGGTPNGVPTLVLPAGEEEKYVCSWSAVRGGFVLKKRNGTLVVFK